MIKLKPCPFCGWKNVSMYVYTEKTYAPQHTVSCAACGAEGGWALTKNKAIKKWNNRK